MRNIPTSFSYLLKLTKWTVPYILKRFVVSCIRMASLTPNQRIVQLLTTRRKNFTDITENDDVMERIFKNLDPLDRVRFSRTCTAARYIYVLHFENIPVELEVRNQVAWLRKLKGERKWLKWCRQSFEPIDEDDEE